MIRVKVTTAAPEIPLIRQTPDLKGIIRNYQFFVDEPVKNPDWWVVIENLSEKQTAHCSKRNTVLVAQETSAMKMYSSKFLKQFGTVITCQREMKHPHKIYTQQGHLWHVGWFGSGSGVDPKDYKKTFTTYNQFKEKTDFKKEKLLSVVTSYKNRTPGQALRHNFIKKMKEHFGDRMDVFGAGINPLRDKMDGIAPYKYHFAIENSFVPDYWTEKLSDSYLGGAYPIYYGHPSVYNYFSKDALTIIDINDIQGSIETVEKVISENYFEKRKKNIAEARELILDKYNLFTMLADVIDSLVHECNPKTITLVPQKKTNLKQSLVRLISKAPLLYSLSRKMYRSLKKSTKYRA